MRRVLILGANGGLARHTTSLFLETTDAAPTLYLRRASRLRNPDPKRVRIVDGDVLETAALTAAMKDQDVVYANLAGDMKAQADPSSRPSAVGASISPIKASHSRGMMSRSTHCRA